MSNPYFNSNNGYRVRIPGMGQSPDRAPTQAPLPVQRAHAPPGSPMPQGHTSRQFDASRTLSAGGDLAAQTLLQTMSTFERLYRRLPEEGMFSPSVSPSNPFVFELGAFTVPSRMTLLLYNMRPDVYRFSGVDPGDYLPVEARRFGSIMGFELTVEQEHIGNVNFQINPVAIQRTSQQAFQSDNTETPQANAGQFAIAQAGDVANTQGSSNMILPQRPTRYGAPDPVPFTIYVNAAQTVQAKCLIFRPIPTPIAFVEMSLTGVLAPSTFVSNMQEAYKFPINKGEESIR